MHKSLYKNLGFTIIELIIVICLISMLTAIAVPSFIQWLPNYRLKAAVRDLYSDMQKARMEAVKTNRNVFITFVSGGYNAAGQVGSYQVFVDVDANGLFNAGDRTLAQKNMPKNVSLYQITGLSGNTTAGYNPRGLPCTALGNVEFRNSSRYYKATLSNAGNVKIEQSNDGVIWN